MHLRSSVLLLGAWLLSAPASAQTPAPAASAQAKGPAVSAQAKGPAVSAQAKGPAASAQTPAPAVEAQEQFRQGREAFKRGDYAAALALFRKSQEILPTSGTVLNIAACEEKLGQLVDAKMHYQQVLGELPPNDPRRGFIQHSLEAVEPRIPRLRLDLAARSVVGARVLLDGAPVPPSSLNTDLAVNPGKHTIVVSAPDLPDRSYDATVAEGTISVMTLEPAQGADPGASAAHPAPPPIYPATPSPPPALPRPSAPPPDERRRAAGWVLTGIGAIGLGTFGVTGALSWMALNQVQAACPDRYSCTDAGVRTAHTGKALAWTSAAALVVGVASVSTGAYLLLTSHGSAPPATSIGISVLPARGMVELRQPF